MTSTPGTDGPLLVKVFALPTGQLHHPDRWLFEDGDEDLVRARQAYPDFSFLIQHPSGRCILFDLGLRKDLENIPEVIRKKASHIIEPVAPQDAIDILQKGPVHPSSIGAVVFSHLHFDHVGDCTKFPDADMIAGPGSKAASGPGWPADPGSPCLSSVIEHPRYKELSFETDRWAPFGPFDRAYDFFDDATFFLIDTPGHMPGHLGAMARTGHDEWVFMGGDCCHHRSLLMGSRPMSVTLGPAGTTCFHKDPEMAQRTIEKIRELAKTDNVLVALAHDSYLQGRMPEYPKSLNGWTGSQWKQDLDAVLHKDYGPD